MRSSLKCHSFDWYLKNVYPGLFLPYNSQATGHVSITHTVWFYLLLSPTSVPCTKISKMFSCLSYSYSNLCNITKSNKKKLGSYWHFSSILAWQHQTLRSMNPMHEILLKWRAILNNDNILNTCEIFWTNVIETHFTWFWCQGI